MKVDVTTICICKTKVYEITFPKTFALNKINKIDSNKCYNDITVPVIRDYKDVSKTCRMSHPLILISQIEPCLFTWISILKDTGIDYRLLRDTMY